MLGERNRVIEVGSTNMREQNEEETNLNEKREIERKWLLNTQNGTTKYLLHIFNKSGVYALSASKLGLACEDLAQGLRLADRQLQKISKSFSIYLFTQS